MYYERGKETISEKNGKENKCNFVSKKKAIQGSNGKNNRNKEF